MTETTVSNTGTETATADSAFADSDEATHISRYTETGYKTEAWRYRHGVAFGLVCVIAVFLLAGKSVWGGISGIFSGFATCWHNDVKPLFRS